LGRREGVYAFLHRSFQEYLAACHLANTERDFGARLRDLVWEDLDWWREVFLSGVGKKRQGGLGDAVNLVNALVPEGPGEVMDVTETHWRAAALAGEALLDLDLAGKTAGRPHYQALLKRVRRWLASLLEGGYLAARERAEAGDTLGKLGDPRPGVRTITVGDEGQSVTVPDIRWVEVPAGPFLMGSPEDDETAYADEHPQHELGLPTFYVARYLITNAQYRPFVEGGGYDEPRHWTEEGWGWRTGEREPDLSAIDDEERRELYANWLAGRPVERRDEPFWWNHPRWGLLNRPVVGVTWYEALAYSRWLTGWLQAPGCTFQAWRTNQLETLNLEPGSLTVQLPSEAEWEKAARGVDGRRWPWGDEWIEGRANTDEAGIEETSAVGAFPGGASPWGVLDVGGNVWEWTRSRWGGTSIYRPDYGYPYDSGDGREELSGPDLRVVRGGSWLFNQRFARCACRLRYVPDFFGYYVGFRVVVSLVNSES
jgi:formylglycine-generating enzyme required for sulfatase activity